jgi:HTH-type transcriptional regulator/antitoxin HigA
MNKVSKEQYKFALNKIEELLPLVDDNTPANDKSAVELSLNVRYSHCVRKRTLSYR